VTHKIKFTLNFKHGVKFILDLYDILCFNILSIKIMKRHFDIYGHLIFVGLMVHYNLFKYCFSLINSNSIHFKSIYSNDFNIVFTLPKLCFDHIRFVYTFP